MTEKKIYKPRPVSGFPEWLPEVRLVEQQWMDHIRRVFESYGFCSIETPSVEELDVINAKGGDTDKEIYVIERLHKEDGDKEARLALHFDQTVPLARYTAQHFNDLVFPFKRYQMQRVWRGERPQAGRFREFYQCDIDVINVDHLPLHFDAEMPAIIWEVLRSLPGMENEDFQILLSNRKVMIGLCEYLGIGNPISVLRWIDKKSKIGEDAVVAGLKEEGLDDRQIRHLQNISDIKIGIGNSPQMVEEFELDFEKAKQSEAYVNTTFAEGIKELEFIGRSLMHLPIGAVSINLSIVRGLDYYTGTVYETVFTDDPGYGSICSGGRYDDLAGGYINKHLPGVGISIGFSRLFDRLRHQGKLPVKAKSAADILIVLPSDETRSEASQTARTLRGRGFNVELYHAPQKVKKQLSYAERKGIPYVWFPPFESGRPHEVKNMATGEQTQADPDQWCPNE